MNSWRKIFSWQILPDHDTPVVGDKVEVIASRSKLAALGIVFSDVVKIFAPYHPKGRVVVISKDWVWFTGPTSDGAIGVSFVDNTGDKDVWYFPLEDWKKYLKVIG